MAALATMAAVTTLAASSDPRLFVSHASRLRSCVVVGKKPGLPSDRRGDISGPLSVIPIVDDSNWYTNPFKEQVRALAARFLSAELCEIITPNEMLRFLAVEAFRLCWDDDPERVHECAVIRHGLELCHEHGSIPLTAAAIA